MRQRILSAATIVLALLAVISCGGDTQGGDCGTTTSNVTVQYVFVANEAAQTISSFQISATGVLTPVQNGLQTGGSGPREIAFDSANKLLFVMNRQTANISVFRFDEQTGQLAAVSGSPFATGAAQVTSMVMHPSGKFVFVTDRASGLLAFRVDNATGALTAVTNPPLATGLTQPNFMAIDPSGKFLYVANATAPLTIVGYNVNATTGEILPMQAPFTFGAFTPDTMMTDAKGKYLLVATSQQGFLPFFQIDATTGELTEADYSPADLSSSTGYQLAPVGDSIYALDTTVRAINLLVIESGGSILFLGTQQLNGALSPSSIAADSTGKFVLVTDSSGATIASYSINSTTRELSSVGPAVPSGAGAGRIATGTVVKQVTTPVPCVGGSGGGRRV